MANSLIVICGPTGTGKTSLGIKLAQKINGEILSADSRQVFKEADIGTNKFNPQTDTDIIRGDGWWIQEGVKIWLYDLVSPEMSFSLSEFIQQADKQLSSILERGKTPLLVGGTGFYIDSFLGERPYASVPPNPVLRQKYQEAEAADLWRILVSQSPELQEEINESDRHNQRRLLRYLEILNSGQTLQQAQTYHRLPEGLKIVYLGLSRERKSLYHKADLWTKKIVSEGLIAETADLIKKYSSYDIPLLRGLIYQPTVDYLQKKINRVELVEKIQFQLHHYIRRQVVWFKRNKRIVWLESGSLHLEEEALSVIG